MRKTLFRAIALLVLVAVITVTLFITVVSANDVAAVLETSVADAQAQDNGTLRGMVFYDSNQNGVKDAGEAGMPGQTVTVSSSGKWSYTYTSGGDGSFGPAGLSPSYYSIKLTVPYGYRPTTRTEYTGLGVGIDKAVFTGLNFGLISSYGAPQTGGPPVVTPPIYYPPIYYPPPPPPVAPPPQVCTYVIKPGDSLGLIAQRYGTTIWALASLNHISNPDVIYAGKVLYLPGCTVNPPPPKPPATGTYMVVHGDTLYRIAVRFGTTVPHLSALNGIINPNLIYAGQVLIVPAG